VSVVPAARPVRIGTIAGLYGDRFSAAEEMLAGEVDVLAGDWLAELTMLILARTRQRRPDGGYGRTFVAQMREVMGEVLDRGVRVVVNAGGLDPLGCAAAVEEAAAGLGLAPRVAAVTGDDLMPRLAELMEAGETFTDLDTGEPLVDAAGLLVANAYLGGWGIAEALDRGADIVVTGRVADASLVVGAAAWWHGWGRTDWDPLAGAVVAGHVVECSAQATGGNFSFFTELPGMERPGFPWVEVAADGSAIVGKHDGTGGAVTVETVASQLLYEIAGPEYPTPDVTARFDTVRIAPAGPDRVALTGIRGEPPPPTLKVAAALPGGYRNSVLVGITGLDADAKADLFVRQFWAHCPWGPDDYDEVRVTRIGRGEEDPSNNAAAISLLELAVRSGDAEKAGRRWADAMVQAALGSIPGLFGLWPPREAAPYAVFWPTTVDRSRVAQTVHVDGETVTVTETDPGEAAPVAVTPPPPATVPAPPGPTRRVPLGRVVGARSGDKGGAANLGVFTRTPDAYPWLASFLTVERLCALLPDLAGHRIDRHEFPNLHALNFVVHGLLDGGVASTLRVDPQAKGLGEYLRAQHVDVPAVLLTDDPDPREER
jgi:hypothetical protein